ncbi:hypothetical protein SRABI128_05148 [Microbacterium sp. Bi128]|nr:hypothetical protein SRABI128_05148 [Microbacterium sp. Bi128]
MLRIEVQPRGDIAELQVQIHDHHAHGRDLPQAHGDVGGNGGLSDAAFGRENTDHSALAAFRLLRLIRPVAAGEGLARPLQKHPHLCRIGRGAEDIPDSGPHGLQDESGIRLADQENRQVRDLDVKHSGEAQGLVDRHVRPQHKNLRLLLVQLGEKVVGTGGQNVGQECLHAALQPAGNRLPQPVVKVSVRRDQDEAAHL